MTLSPQIQQEMENFTVWFRELGIQQLPDKKDVTPRFYEAAMCLAFQAWLNAIKQEEQRKGEA